MERRFLMAWSFPSAPLLPHGGRGHVRPGGQVCLTPGAARTQEVAPALGRLGDSAGTGLHLQVKSEKCGRVECSLRRVSPTASLSPVDLTIRSSQPLVSIQVIAGSGGLNRLGTDHAAGWDDFFEPSHLGLLVWWRPSGGRMAGPGTEERSQKTCVARSSPGTFLPAVNCRRSWSSKRSMRPRETLSGTQ